MEFRVVDFDILTRNFKKYQEGINEVNKERKNFLNQLEPIKKQMNNIIKYTSTGNKSEQEQEQTFQLLQEQAFKLDSDFKTKLNKMRNELNESCFDDLSSIITEWSMENSIDMVFGKMEVVFNTKQYEITDEILNILKEKGIFLENKQD